MKSNQKQGSDKQPPTAGALNQVVREVWVKEISKEYCQKLIDSIPRRIQVVSDNE